MATIWSVQTIFGNVNNAPAGEAHSKSDAEAFETQNEAMAEYGERFKAGLPADATSAMIYLWRADPRPKGRVHSVVKHAHFWKDQDGTHCNEFSGALQV